MERMAVIDIGSNSIRLVIYEYIVGTAFRVVEESKESARLSQRIGSDGSLADEDVVYVAQILDHFKQLCAAHRVTDIRPVATAAIRNARNAEEIVARLNRETGLAIRLLSGGEEARYGFLGMVNTMEIEDGLLVDIGGGSTEITLFRNRRVRHSRSLPFGAVNTMKRFAPDGQYDRGSIERIERMVCGELDKLPWVRKPSDLTLIGLGGTFRNLGKMHQRCRDYSIALLHGYRMTEPDVDGQLNRLLAAPAGKRKEVDGLSKDRADIILSGLAILRAVYRYAGCAAYQVCSATLCEGLLFETLFPGKGLTEDVYRFGAENLLAINPYASHAHVRQVNRIALQLFDRLERAADSRRTRTVLHAATLLYRIGIAIDYYRFRQHTFYMLSQSNLFGLDHREILLTALIASYNGKKQTRRAIARHPDLLDKRDFPLVVRLGTLLQLAIALDRSETQPIVSLEADVRGAELALTPRVSHPADIEKRELAAVADDFKKEWGLRPVWDGSAPLPFSRTPHP